MRKTTNGLRTVVTVILYYRTLAVSLAHILLGRNSSDIVFPGPTEGSQK